MGNCQKEQQVEDGIPRNGPIEAIRITNYVWTKDYQGLFDYQSTAIKKSTVKVKINGFLSKEDSTITVHKYSPGEKGEQILRNSMFQMVKKEHFYQISPIYLEEDHYTFQKMLWLVVKSIPQKFYQLKQKDVIKLGKQKIRVRQLMAYDQNPSMVVDFENILVSKTVYTDITSKKNEQLNQNKNFLSVQSNQKKALSQVTTTDPTCRICLQIGQTTNPLITPCKCIGSVKYIHLKCLRIWLGKRLQQSKSQHCITINWQPLTCQMCKSPFKYRIYMDNKKFYSVQIPKPPKPYVVLQVLRKNDGSKGKLFHFVSLSFKKKVALGRKKDIDVKISDDISVSRNHASIEYRQSNKSFVLVDNNSKFGSLILIKKCLQVRPIHNGISFQVGAQVFSCEAIRSKGGVQQKNIGNEYFPDEIDEEEDNENEEAEQDESSQEMVNEEQNEQELRSPQIVPN